MKKKVISIILTLTCLLGLSTTAFAAENVSLPAQELQQVQVPSSETNIITPMTADDGVINADGVRVRSTPSTSGTVLGLLYKGDLVTVGSGKYYGSGYTWYYVTSYRTGISGYVVSSYVTIVS